MIIRAKTGLKMPDESDDGMLTARNAAYMQDSKVINITFFSNVAA